MTHSLRLAVVSPGRTSSGGSAFSENLVRGLESVLDRSVLTAKVPATGSAGLPSKLDDCDAVVFLGARAVHTGAPYSLFWPLNVAPLDYSLDRMPHVSVRNRLRHRLLRARLGQSIRHADAMVFGSHYARSLYLARYATASRLPYRVIPGGTPSLDVTPPSEQSTRSGRLVLCCSHLYPYKGILEFVEALGRVRDQLPASLQVRIAGADRDRTYAAAVLSRVNELGLAPMVHVGPASNHELRSLYSRAEIAVFPSTCENAGSFSLFDGFHAGLPTICSDRSSMPEMARGAAVLVNPHEPDRFGRTILDLLSSPSHQDALRRQSRDWVDAVPTWTDRARMLVEFVADLTDH